MNDPNPQRKDKPYSDVQVPTMNLGMPTQKRQHE